MNINKIFIAALILLVVCANLFALFAGFFDYALSSWALQEGESIDWPALFFYIIAFINIIYMTIKLIHKLVLTFKVPKRTRNTTEQPTDATR